MTGHEQRENIRFIRYLTGYLVGCTYFFAILAILLVEKYKIVPVNDFIYMLLKVSLLLINIIISAFIIGLAPKITFKNWFLFFSQPFVLVIPALIAGVIAPETDLREQSPISLFDTLMPFFLTVVFPAIFSLIAAANPLELMLKRMKTLQNS